MHNPAKIRIDFSVIAFSLVYFCVMFFNYQSRGFLSTVLLLIASSVILGAFGSHGLKDVLTTKKFEVYQTACQYLSIHSIALLLLLVLNNTTNYRLSPKTIYSLFFGIVVFCISLFLVSVAELLNQNGLNKLGMIAPIGGLMMILGYVFAAIDLFKKPAQ